MCSSPPCGVVHLGGGAGAPLVTRATPEGTTCERTHAHTHTADGAAVIRIGINHEGTIGSCDAGTVFPCSPRRAPDLRSIINIRLVHVTVSQVSIHGI